MTNLDFLSRLTGRRVPGGCDTCEAYQTVSQDGPVWRLTVHHDEWCPTYRGRP